MISLGDNPKGGKAQVWHILNQTIGEECPKTAQSKGKHFVPKEVNMLIARFVRATEEPCLAKAGTPWRWLHKNRNALMAKKFEEADGQMAGVGKGRS